MVMEKHGVWSQRLLTKRPKRVQLALPTPHSPSEPRVRDFGTVFEISLYIHSLQYI